MNNFRSSLDAYPLPYIRGDASFSREFTVQEWLSVIRNPTCRKVWDVRFEDAQVLKVLNNNETIAYSTQKGTFPVAARDFVTKTSLIKENTGYYYLVYSVNPDEFADLTNVPKEGYLGRVRGDLKIACWVLIDKGSSIDISYIVGVDVKGNIPSTIIKSVQAQTPQCINKVEEYLKNKGPPCFVFREDLGKGISSLTENLQENTLTIKFLYESDSKEPSNSKRTGLRISIPKQNFKNGANIGLNLEEKNGYKIFGKVEEPQEFLEVGKSCYKVFFLEFYKNTDKKEEMSVRHLADDDGDDEDSDYEEDEGAVIRTEIEDVNDNTKKLGEVVEKINVTVVVQPNKDGWILNGKHLK
ncbi:hypothetical protein HK099_006865 [Clydaea vesicula]|uniref:START domain-containing protein n=1 Tax=Clydaea vesicula TaxID=447962 RepID=A0AAD5Y2E4_9FUNG|nr:hypothetical protein HK099_006865 [Clydaea vesicula]